MERLLTLRARFAVNDDRRFAGRAASLVQQHLEVRLTGAGQVMEPLLTLRAGFDMSNDPGFVGQIQLLVQQPLELLIARA